MQRNDVSNKLLTSTRARLAEIGGTVASTEPQPCVSSGLHPSHAQPADWRSGGKNASKLRKGPLLFHISARCPPCVSGGFKLHTFWKVFNSDRR